MKKQIIFPVLCLLIAGSISPAYHPNLSRLDREVDNAYISTEIAWNKFKKKQEVEDQAAALAKYEFKKDKHHCLIALERECERQIETDRLAGKSNDCTNFKQMLQVVLDHEEGNTNPRPEEMKLEVVEVIASLKD